MRPPWKELQCHFERRRVASSRVWACGKECGSIWVCLGVRPYNGFSSSWGPRRLHSPNFHTKPLIADDKDKVAATGHRPQTVLSSISKQSSPIPVRHIALRDLLTIAHVGLVHAQGVEHTLSKESCSRMKVWQC